jgi:hypothetical protein
MVFVLDKEDVSDFMSFVTSQAFLDYEPEYFGTKNALRAYQSGISFVLRIKVRNKALCIHIAGDSSCSNVVFCEHDKNGVTIFPLLTFGQFFEKLSNTEQKAFIFKMHLFTNGEETQ